jgi:hypothetical protein
MSWVTVRQFRWTSRTGADGYPEVRSIKSFGTPSRLPIDVADVVLMNAMAPAASARIKYATRENELRLLKSYLVDRPDGAIHLLADEFKSSSGHVQRFVSESFGLGMLSAAVQSAYAWVAGPGALANFDALPTSLAREYARSRVRPDLLFRGPGFLLAGEARGRSSKPPLSLRGPWERLDTLLPWAHAHEQPLVMTWAYLTKDGVTVDFYAPEDGIDWLDEGVGDPRPAPPDLFEREAIATVPHEFEVFEATGVDRAIGSNVTPAVRVRPSRSTGPASAATLFTTGETRLPVVAEQLFESAPETSARFAGRRVRGRWIPIDPVNRSRGSLLLGVLSEPLPTEEGWELTRRLRDRHRGPEADQNGFDGGELAIAVRGRLFVAVTRQRRGQPWDLLGD